MLVRKWSERCVKGKDVASSTWSGGREGVRAGGNQSDSDASVVILAGEQSEWEEATEIRRWVRWLFGTGSGQSGGGTLLCAHDEAALTAHKRRPVWR